MEEGILMGREDIAGMRDKEVERRRVTGGRWWRFYEKTFLWVFHMHMNAVI